MRYTTIIDISEFPAVYKNINARLIYLHLALKSGYHDNDRDLIDISIRRLAAAVGLTLSATRHALGQLEKANLITRQGSLWFVKKWVIESTISTRAKTARQQKAIEAEAERRAENERRERENLIEKQRRENLRAQGKTSFMLYYEDLLKKAAAGDSEAQELVKKHRRTYEQHQKNFVSNQKSQ